MEAEVLVTIARVRAFIVYICYCTLSKWPASPNLVFVVTGRDFNQTARLGTVVDAAMKSLGAATRACSCRAKPSRALHHQIAMTSRLFFLEARILHLRHSVKDGLRLLESKRFTIANDFAISVLDCSEICFKLKRYCSYVLKRIGNAFLQGHQ